MSLRFMTLASLLAHCKADGDDGQNIEAYGEAAEWAAESILNRNVYATAEQTAAAGQAARTALRAAFDDYAIDHQDATDDLGRDLATHTYDQARIAAWRDINAITIDPELLGAMHMHAAHLWNNRTDVVTGQYGSAAQAVPMNSQWIYARKRLVEGAAL